MAHDVFTGQLRRIFLEEAEDHIELMERGLLQLDAGSADQELMNAVFRAAHSMKGGAGTFGLAPIVDLTHLLESLLDEVRAGQRGWSSPLGSALLASVDDLRGMLDDIRSETEPVRSATPAVLERLQQLLDAQAPPAAAERRLHITFRPHADLMARGNDPLLLIRELGRLGDLTVNAKLDQLPPIEDLDPQTIRLGWELSLSTSATDDDVHEVFSWVEDECDLEISAGASPPALPKPAVSSGGTTERTAPSRESGSIRVGIEKVDALVDMVGELVITQSMLSQLGRDFDEGALEALRVGLQQLERNTRELQEGVMRMRMLPIGFVFARLPRLVRDLSGQLEKKIAFTTSGENTELDKTVLEKMSDPLVHIIRNSVDHGIESPEQRGRAGKPEAGSVRIEASHQGGAIVIEVSDDGAGIDPERLRAKGVERGLLDPDAETDRERLLELIFHPGLSTAAEVSDISGRGVGMDVVRRNIHELGGTIDVESEIGVGTRFTIRLPLTLAILDGQLFRLGHQTYVLPLVSVIESFVPSPDRLSRLGNGAEVYRLRESFLPVVRLARLFGLEGDDRRFQDGLLVVTESPNGPIALFVDELLGQQQVVIKSLETNFDRVDGVAGATILGNGSVALIVDVPGLLRLQHRLHREGPARGPRAA
jgi:two-component system chemotaxis sensor kinase CheA